jgi:hypothetical protein
VEAPSAPVVAPTVAAPAVAQPTTPAATTVAAPVAGATARHATTPTAGSPGHSLSGGATPVAGSAAPAPSLAPVAAAAPVAAPVVTATAPEAPQVEALAAEHTLLSSGFEARSNPREALAIADRHAREYPNGQMAADREFIAVQALSDLGRADETRARGEALIARFPSSPYVQRVRRLLDSLP